MADEQLSVQSATGVDLTLSIAGPGNRSYAFVIDWHIRLLLGCAWLLLANFVLKLSLSPKSEDALVSLLPAAIIYFLYHPILEVAMRGRTPGKRMAGVRIVNRNGGAPGTAALLIRNIFRLIDGLPICYMVGLVSCFATANRVRIGDMAAGTLLVLDDAAAVKSLARLETLAAGSRLPLDALELVDQVLERWTSLESRNRMQIARSLLARVEAGSDPAHLSSLSEAQLHARLRALLPGGEPAAGEPAAGGTVISG
ncbi:MAG TPA: RDD family protein [Steroidobacteraceae bacterium]|nr:RDD family protein [Steroidobacteraceae bacterium]